MAAIGQTSAQLSLRDPDVRLMIAVRDDVPGAFEELVGAYQHRLISVMQHLVGRTDEAEDLAQEVFLARLPGAEEVPGPLQVLHLAVHDRQQPRPELAAQPPAQAGGAAAGPGLRARSARAPPSSWSQSRDKPPSQRMQQEELAAVVRRALDTLNERQRMAVVLNKFEDMNYAEIAEVMGLTTKAVKSLLNRARSALPGRLRLPRRRAGPGDGRRGRGRLAALPPRPRLGARSRR